MKRTLYVLTIAVAIAAAAGIWNRQPWMRPGSSVQVGRWKFGDNTFEIWQRKNDSFLEAFATGLFVSNGSNHWQVFCLDIEDTFLPEIEVRIKGALVEVTRSGKEVGEFDPLAGVFKYQASGPIVVPGFVTNAPPADWWVGR